DETGTNRIEIRRLAVATLDDDAAREVEAEVQARVEDRNDRDERQQAGSHHRHAAMLHEIEVRGARQPLHSRTAGVATGAPARVERGGSLLLFLLVAGELL